MVKTKDEAIRLAKQLVSEANKVFYIKEAYLFGSYANGTPHRWSDIDVAIVSPDFKYIPENMSMKMLFRLASTIATEIEPIPLIEEEINAPMLGTIGHSVAKDGILL